MSTQLAHTVINGFNRQPALLAVSYADMLTTSIRSLAAADDDEEERIAQSTRNNLASRFGYSSSAENKPFAYADGIAFIPVTGLLINRFSYSWSWITGYNFIRNQLNAALEDSDVKGIVFDCDSGGGMVAGCFELCEDIYKARAVKPSIAVVDASSYSACYAIASSASKVIATPSAGVGSVGVVAMHIDFSKMLDEAGIKVTFIYSGDHKVDGNAFEPLPSSVKKDIQKDVDTVRKEFVALVARNRGTDPEVIFGTEAQTYNASDALTLGLIDAIAPPIEAVTAFFIELSGSETEKEMSMSTPAAKKPGAESEAAAPTEQPNAAAAAPAQTVDVAAERASERDRIRAITTHEAAKDKPALASHLALNTDLSVEEAAKIMSAAAPEKKEAAAEPPKKSAFETAMDASDHPKVGAETAGTEKTAAQRILEAQALATGTKH